MLLSQAVEVIEGESQDSRLQSQRTEAFLSLARFSDAQYQSIDKYMKSSEFENKQALLQKAKEEVDLIRESKVTSNRLFSTFNSPALYLFVDMNCVARLELPKLDVIHTKVQLDCSHHSVTFLLSDYAGTQ